MQLLVEVSAPRAELLRIAGTWKSGQGQQSTWAKDSIVWEYRVNSIGEATLGILRLLEGLMRMHNLRR